jgi:hypothetical protein
VALSVGRTKNAEIMPRLSKSTLPSEVINQLYIPDLKGIITENWGVFGSLFDNKLERFTMNMDTLNIARRIDAHAKPITDGEASEYENCYSWLLGRIEKVPL